MKNHQISMFILYYVTYLLAEIDERIWAR